MAGGRTARLEIAEERVGRVLTGFMALGFLALIAAAIAIGWINGRNQQYAASIVHTQTVRQTIADVQVALEQSETARRGYLLTGSKTFSATYRRTAAAIPPGLAQLRMLTADNPRQTARIDRIRITLDRLAERRRASVALVDGGDSAGARASFRFDTSVILMRAIRTRLGAMARDEELLLASRDARQRQATTLFYGVLVAAAILLALVAAISLIVVRRNVATITRSRDSLRQLAGSLEEQVVERTADLSRANDEIQRFAYIVSHDLRSPLVNVMGFTAELEAATGEMRALVERAEEQAPEIVTEDARLAAREDLPEAIGFIRSSTQKMDRLINAILALSRQGRRVLAPEPLDLAAIVQGISDSLAHRIEERGTTIAIEGTLPALVSDRLAIEQILSNLIENAVKYLKPGDSGRITLRGERNGSRVAIEIEDDGRGIDPRDHGRVFDLFRRSGQQDQPGEGIGLANVRALAQRLGGTIDLRSALGEGATFRLSLPATLEPQERSK